MEWADKEVNETHRNHLWKKISYIVCQVVGLFMKINQYQKTHKVLKKSHKMM